MKIGLQIQKFNYPGAPGTVGDTLAKIAQAADAAGFASIWAMDHVFQITGVALANASSTAVVTNACCSVWSSAQLTM